MGRRFDVGVGVFGALLLANAAVSTVLYRGDLKIRDEEFTFPSAQVVFEVALSLVLCLWAALKIPGSFLPILSDAKENRVTMFPANLDFMVFNHRGKLFPPKFVEAEFS
ncbi:membrane magnesium transporter [Physcomitrium patens]|uniref:Membrane magnesium transporter n=1 Tax=Physcomitrium patens TaxID=3218 RepID=A9TN71_PHYPA|nr:membrane magnesium transporter-like [Physcomitrium patens]PNR52327.1 hypothetical protein PHYPA_008701 [Physcomitrium patens]|eukprot:XP_024379174.1 membrane magnesium transporter-like [Physcomitrella patens]